MHIYTTIEELKALPNNCTWAPIRIEIEDPDGDDDVWGEDFIKQEDGLHHPDGNVGWDELEDLFNDECKVYAIQTE